MSREPAIGELVSDRPLKGVRLLFVVNVDWFFISHRLPILRAAVDHGATVAVASADTGRLREIASHGVETFALPMSRAGTSLGEQARVAWSLLRVVRTFRPGIVHNVTVKPVLIGTAVTRVFRRRTRIINAISGFGFAVEGEASHLLRRAVVLAYRVLLRSSRVTVVVQNEGARSTVVEQRFSRPGRVELIEGSGVHCGVFAPRSSPSNERVRVVMASRLLRDKGVVEFCRACALVVGRMEALLAGSLDVEGNPTAMTLGEVEELCEATGVTYVGEVADMPSFLNDADVFVLPSYHEGLPKALIEAAACGLPLVATDIDGCRPVVAPGENGILVPARSVEPLAEALDTLVNDADLRARFGAFSRARAVERFSIDHVVSSFIALYEREAAA